MVAFISGIEVVIVESSPSWQYTEALRLRFPKPNDEE